MKRRFPSPLRLLPILAAAILARAEAAEILFHDGGRMADARIVTTNGESISVIVQDGMVRLPISSIKSIDGRPPAEFAAALQPAAEPPTATPPSTDPRSAAGTTPSSRVQTQGNNRTDTDPTANTATPRSGRFAVFLLTLLAGSAIWMRSLVAVQRSLLERRAEPRFWSMTALLLPGLGAAMYFVALRIHQARQKSALRGAGTAKLQSNGGSGSEAPSKGPVTIDPAAYLARKGRARKGFTFLDTERRSVALKNDSELVSGLELAGEMLEEALLEKASDIHIEPTGTHYRVRFRLDGILHERSTYEQAEGRRLVLSLKTLAEIDIAEKRRAQDGRFQARIDDRDVDFRVATANSIHGEKMVIRVLDHRSGVFDLPALGMSEEMLTTFQNVIHSRNGMILATGPTGSGKTSTLYAALRQLDASKLNIMTIEDPAEYELDGATQIAVNTKAGVTYEAGLRSILRQDPDVILVGEMRDAEAGAVAVRAALTGHLVFSSLHTKDAIGTISRLQDMGIERYQLGSALLMILGQRLVRVLCAQCRAPYPAQGNELASIGIAFDSGATLYGPVGCDKCHGTGFRGRTGIFELLVLDDQIRKAVSDGIDENGLMELAATRGYRSYRYDGAEKALLGITTVEEVLQAI